MNLRRIYLEYFMFILILVGASLLVVQTSPDINSFYGELAQNIKNTFHANDSSTLIVGLFSIIGYLGLTVSRMLFLTIVFLLVEIYHHGIPKNWKLLIKATLFKCIKIWIILFLTVFISKIIPQLNFGSLITINQKDVEQIFGGFTTTILSIIGFVLLDLSLWITHYLSHKIPILWHFHQVHHSIEDLQAANNYTHPIESFIESLGVIIISLLLSLQYESILLILIWQASHDDFVHQKSNFHLGPLRNILVDNRYHHFHHSCKKEHFDMNFSANLVFWDKLFGTYMDPGESLVKTGVNGVKPPSNVIEFLTGILKKR